MSIIAFLQKSSFVAIVMLTYSVTAAGTEIMKDGRETDHKALQLLGEKTAKMLNEQNFKEMKSCFSKKFVFIPIDQSVITSVDEFKKYYRTIKTDNNYGVTGMKITPSYDIPTVFTGSDTGYCYGTADNIFILKGGKSVHVKSRWSASFVKENEKWKIAMVQSGVDMLDNPMLSAVKGVAELQIKIAGIVIIMLMFLTIYLQVRRRKTSVATEAKNEASENA